MLVKMNFSIKSEVEVDVTFPCYRTTGHGMFWAIIDRETCLYVMSNKSMMAEISYCHIESAWVIDDTVYCNEDKFMEAYYFTLNKLSNVFAKENTHI